MRASRTGKLHALVIFIFFPPVNEPEKQWGVRNNVEMKSKDHTIKSITRRSVDWAWGAARAAVERRSGRGNTRRGWTTTGG
jgi:hypothetical protein